MGSRVKINVVIVGLATLISISCSGDSNFSGQTAPAIKTPEVSNDAGSNMGNDTPQFDEGLGEDVEADLLDGEEEVDEIVEEATPEAEVVVPVATDIPDDAVTQGSFTAWTEPKDPAPHQPYRIIINIDQPNATTQFSIAELHGNVTGTDGFQEGIGRDHFSYLEGGWGQKVWVQPGYARLSIFIPGADYLVQDRIYIRSEQLNEEATINLQF